MKKVLLTGAGGFIGRNLTESLDGVCQLYCPSSQELNLLDAERTREYLRQHQFEIVIHAANRNSTRNRVTPYDSLDGNLRMFFNLERCRNLYGRLLYFGSGAEYSREYDTLDVKETDLGTHIPQGAYGFSKYIMAKICESSGNIYEFCLFGVYGKYEEWERRFISNAICRGLKGLDITIEQNVYFDYLWVEDLARIVRWFMDKEPRYKRYHVCRGEKADLYSLAVMVRETLGIDCDITVAMEGWKPPYTGSNERLLQELGMFQFTSFEESIQKLCSYYREHLREIDVAKL